jgi:hypothetical protein
MRTCRETSLVIALVVCGLLAIACSDDGGVPGGADATVGDGSASGGGADADPTAPDGGGGTPDAAGGGGTPDAAGGGGSADAAPGAGVACGETTCFAPQICCVTGGGPGAMAACADPGTCMGAEISCDGPEDCPSDLVCCGSLSPTGGGATECQPATGCSAVICHVDGDCPTPGNICCDYGFGSSICTAFCF